MMFCQQRSDRETKVGGRIFALRDDGELAPMDEAPYALEEVLQRLLADYPDLLAVEQDGKEPAWLLISREAGVPGEEAGGNRWAVDHLFLDRAGVPTLVEVKRSSDTRLRREVIGQMLDYAANAVVYWSPDAIRQRFEARCEADGRDPGEVIAEFLGEPGDAESFWDRVRTNLQAERVRMILVADEIPRETQRIIEFLNGQLDPAEVLGVEIRQFIGEGIKTLVPQVIGRTAEAEQKKTKQRPSRKWDAGSFDEDLANRFGQDALQAARRIRSWATERNLETEWGRGATYGSFSPKSSRNGARCSMFSVSTDGLVQVALGSMRQPPFDELSKRRELLDRLNANTGLTVRADDLANSWPTLPLHALTDQSVLARFLETWDWFLAELA
jgi:hypothetical protein